MPLRYQDVYPSAPLLDSSELARPTAADLLTLEYFEAEPGEMPAEVFAQHHILLNLRDAPQRVVNLRGEERLEYELRRYGIVVTPAGMRSGWHWFVRSRVIIITLEPDALERFAMSELGILLTPRQLRDTPLFEDKDLCIAGLQLKEAIETRDVGSELLFESLARVFLVKLIRKFGERHTARFAKGFTAESYKRVLDFVATEYHQQIGVEDLAREAGLSSSHFSRLFKQTIGCSPHQFVMKYRVERARRQLMDATKTLIDVALGCGFSDQAHFSRVFKQVAGHSPKKYREGLLGH